MPSGIILPQHRRLLQEGSGLSAETIQAAGLWSATREEVTRLVGFDPGCGGLVFPYPGTGGFCRVRLDVPYRAPGWDKAAKYLTPKGVPNRLYIPPSLHRTNLQGTAVLVITEGEKKSLKATQEGIPCIATSGVWAWKTRGTGGEKLPDEQGLLEDFGKLRLRGRSLVILVYDSDITADHPAWPAYNRLARELLRRGVRRVKLVTLPALPQVTGKTGLDDFLVHRGSAEFYKLVNAAPDWSPVEVAESEPVAWPASLREDALHGLAGDFVRLVGPQTEADPAALLLQFLVAFGNCVGRTAHFVVEADAHYANEFLVLVGPTARARKGTAWGHVRRLFECAEEWETAGAWSQECIDAGLSSGEGLIWRLRDSASPEDPGVPDKRLLVIEAEFAAPLRVMAREGNVLSAVLRCAWDTGRLTTLVKTNRATATGAHVSVIGHATREETLRYLDRTECANGFGNRFLWAAVRRSKLLPEGGCVPEGDFRTLALRVRDAAAFAQGLGQVGFDDAARSLWRDAYPRLTQGTPGLLGAILARAEAHAVRLALIYALLDRSPVIRPEHLRAALAVWAYCEQSARFVFGDALGDPTADAILQALRGTPGGLSRTEIRDLFGRNKSEREVARALRTLLENGLARCEHVRTQGRPAEVWRAAAHDETTNDGNDKSPAPATAPDTLVVSVVSRNVVSPSPPAAGSGPGDAAGNAHTTYDRNDKSSWAEEWRTEEEGIIQ